MIEFMVKKKKSLTKWLRFGGAHYTIQRFGLLIGFVSMVLLACISLGAYSQYKYDANRLTTVASYSSTFKMSRTESEGQVVNVFTNADRTKAFVLLKFKDITKVSANANDYQMFLGVMKVSGNKSNWSYKPAGSIYVFGSTGYMGIYLTNEAGFESQVLELTLRGNSELVPVTAKVHEETGRESFAKYDQIRLNINPGATGVEVLETLDGDETHVAKLFEEMVLKREETKIREDLHKSLVEMKAKLSAIDEYTRRAKELNIDGRSLVVPSPTDDIKGDKVTDIEGKLYLETKYTYPQGYNFTWQDASLGSYGSLVRKEGKSLFETIRAKRNEKDVTTSTNLNDVKWKLNDGTDFNALTNDGRGLSIIQEASSVVANVQKAWSEYQNLKEKYQKTELPKLLDLELQLENVSQNYTVNASESVLRVY